MKPKLLIIVLCIIVLFSALSAPVFAIDMNESSVSEYTIDYYEYPITVDSPSWFQYTVLEKVEMLRIPEKILNRMSDEALVQAIVDFPYIGDIYYYGSGVYDGVHTVAKYCSALNELITRESGIRTLKSYGQITIQNKLSTYSATSDYRDSFEAQVLSDIIMVLDTNTTALQSPALATVASAPVTPNGTSLPSTAYSIRTEPHSMLHVYHTNKDQNAIDTYGVTLVRKGSCIYNCHSYAWHSQDASNPYWIDNPSTYWNDGSYSMCYTGNVITSIYDANIANGYIVVYGPSNNSTHSAILTGNTNMSSLNSLATVRCISKWGDSGVFKHTLTQVPAEYIYSTIRIYK